MCYRVKKRAARKIVGAGKCKAAKKHFFVFVSVSVSTRQTNVAELNSLRFTQFLTVLFNCNNCISFAFRAVCMTSQKANFS